MFYWVNFLFLFVMFGLMVLNNFDRFAPFVMTSIGAGLLYELFTSFIHRRFESVSLNELRKLFKE